MRRVSIFCLIALAAAAPGCRRPVAATVPPGPPSPAGWEVRYNATLALANRGSPLVKEDPAVWDNLLEMLDEEQQLRNFTRKRPDGQAVPDETAARTTVIGALRAVAELHRQRPALDLSGLNEPIERLTRSANVPVRTRAAQTQLILSQ
jgi:hypothetical protein